MVKMEQTELPKKLREIIILCTLLICIVLPVSAWDGSVSYDELTFGSLIDDGYYHWYYSDIPELPTEDIDSFELNFTSYAFDHDGNHGGASWGGFIKKADGNFYGLGLYDVAGGTGPGTVYYDTAVHWPGDWANTKTAACFLKLSDGYLKFYRNDTLLSNVSYSGEIDYFRWKYYNHDSLPPSEWSVTDVTLNWESDTYTAYSVDISGTGTFCYAQPITFNVSLDGYTDQYAFYWHHFYKDGNPVSYYTEFDGNDDGFMSFSKSLPPGDYVTEAIIEFEEYELSEYLNFTIEDDCSQAFNGTINQTYNPGGVTNFSWEWNDYDFLDNLTPWENPTFNNGSGTSLIDYMLTNGYINQTEYDFLNQSVQNYINETNFYENMTGNYVFGFLTPLEMVNDGITTVRANINGSVIFLTDGIEPVTSIFAVVLQMMPSWVVTIFSIVLTFDAVRIILAGRKS